MAGEKAALTARSVEEAKSFFLGNSRGSLLCSINGKEKECATFPEASEFFEENKEEEPATQVIIMEAEKAEHPFAISLDFVGTYTEHKIFFDEMAKAMQSRGHRVGVIANEREKHFDPNNPGRVINKREIIEQTLDFKPDFMYLWGETETIANGNLWKAERMDQEDVLIHFDDDAAEIKKYTDRWCFKSLNSGDIFKF